MGLYMVPLDHDQTKYSRAYAPRASDPAQRRGRDPGHQLEHAAGGVDCGLCGLLPAPEGPHVRRAGCLMSGTQDPPTREDETPALAVDGWLITHGGLNPYLLRMDAGSSAFDLRQKGR